MVAFDGMSAKAELSKDRQLCGLRVSGNFPLTDLPPWQGDERCPDLWIEYGAVPAELPDLAVRQPLLQVGAGGACRFEIPAVAAYWIAADGRHIRIMAKSEATHAEICTFLFGTVFAILCHRRGWLALHACCVRIGDRAVAFAGDSGVGKSTLAAELMARGHALLSDDVTVIDLAASGVPMVLPMLPHVKLWQDALSRLGKAADGLIPVRENIGKFYVSAQEHFCRTPLPLSALIHLEEPARFGAILRPLGSVAAIERLKHLLYRPRLMLRLQTQAAQTTRFLQMLGAIGGVSALERPENPEDWPQLERQLQALAA